MATAVSSRETYRIGDLRLDVGLQRLTGPVGEIRLPRLSFDLLLALARRAPDFVTNEQLSSLVWGSVVVSPETVTKRVNLLREALGDDAASARYIVGLRSRGYRIVVPVERLEASQALEDVGVPLRRTGPLRAWIGWLPIVILIAGIALALAWARLGERPFPVQDTATEPVAPPDATVAVLPFTDLGPQTDTTALAPALAIMVLERLSTVPGLTVIARDSAFAVDRAGLGPEAAGRALGARYLVEGTVQQADGRLRITASLVDASNGTQAWSTRVDRPATDLFEIQDVLAEAVAGELRERLGRVGALGAAPSRLPPVDAQLAYLRGRALLARYTVHDSERAAAEFQAALRSDPRFASAYAGQFDATMLAAERRHDDLTSAYRQHVPLLEDALRLDPGNGTAVIARAIWGRGSAAEREQDFRRGLELEPTSSRGLVAYAEFLDREGRVDEAKRVLERALVVDPMSPRVHFLRVMLGWESKGWLALEREMLGVLEIDPDFHPALQRYAKYRWILRGELADAAKILERAIAVDPANPWTRHTSTAVYLDLDDPEAARRVAEGTPSSRATEQLLLALYRGDWRTAAETAYSPAGERYNRYESWGAPEAVRDHALRTGEYARAIAWLERRYKLAGPTPALDVANFRAAAYLAELLAAVGERARARALLQRLPPAIDATITPHGAVAALRSKATVQMLAGDRDAALATLSASFRANDLTQWWYTLRWDPTWSSLRQDPRFTKLADEVVARVRQQQTVLAGSTSTGATQGSETRGSAR